MVWFGMVANSADVVVVRAGLIEGKIDEVNEQLIVSYV